MNRRHVAATLPHPSIEKTAPALVGLAGGRQAATGSEADASRAERVRAAAYLLYEARGRVDGHDLEDWLAAEAQVARAP